MFEDPTDGEFYNWPGKRLNVTCHSLGEPSPFVSWWRGSNQIMDNNTYHIFDLGPSSALQVYVRSDDVGWIFGEYTCKSKNDFGEATKIFNMQQASKYNMDSRKKELKTNSRTHFSRLKYMNRFREFCENVQIICN